MRCFYQLLPHKHKYVLKSYRESKKRCISTVNEKGEYGAKWLGTNKWVCEKCGDVLFKTRLHGWLKCEMTPHDNEARFYEDKQ